ncbi:MAG: hypothetical protein IT381_12990 [Deltaproteobacteria bacterium]|nr:hypothetical protein [Deltaproteobacteria bacterium]
MRLVLALVLFAACAAPPEPNSRERDAERATESLPGPFSTENVPGPFSTESLPGPLSNEKGPGPNSVVPSPGYTALKLLPAGRHVLTTSEPLPLTVVATREDGTNEDVSAQAALTVRDPAAGSVVSGRFVPAAGGSRSTIVTATFASLTAAPILVSTVTPRARFDFEASMSVQTSPNASASVVMVATLAGHGTLRVAFSGSAGDTVRVTLPFSPPRSVTNVERVRFLARLEADVDLSSRVSFLTPTAGGQPSYKDVAGTGLIAHRSLGPTSFELSAAGIEASPDARGMQLSFTLSASGAGVLYLDEIELVAQFVLGLNLAWLDGQYAHDFGPSFHHPTWGVAYDPAHVEAILAMMQGLGVRLLRVWVFESCEGLEKDAAERVTGVHPTFWKNFDDFVFTRLPKYDVKVTFMLLGAHHTSECTSPSPIADLAARKAFLDQAMLPFVARYTASPWVWSIDLANEPEGAVAGDTGNWGAGVSWEAMRSFLSEAAAGVKNVAPGVFVSAGSGWHGADSVRAGRFSGLGFSHLDYHEYDDHGALASYTSLQRRARVIVGEGGQGSHTRDIVLQEKATSAMLANAYGGSYWGFLPWAIEAPGVSNEFTLIDPTSSYSMLRTTPALDALGDFIRTHGDVGP